MRITRELPPLGQSQWHTVPQGTRFVTVSVMLSQGGLIGVYCRLTSGVVKFFNVIWADREGITFDLRNTTEIQFRAGYFPTRYTYEYFAIKPSVNDRSVLIMQ